MNYENWEMAYEKYSMEFQEQKEYILNKLDNMPKQEIKQQSVLQKLEKNKEIVAASQIHSTQLHKKNSQPLR